METPFDRAAGMDCCLWPADWIEKATGIDPAASLRGTYRNGAGALRQIRRFGDFVTMWRVCMALSGFVTARRPVFGDVGVVQDAAGQTVAAIRLDEQWAAKGAGGLVMEDFAVIVAWSIAPRG